MSSQPLSEIVAVRFALPQLAELDRLAEALQKERPGTKTTRSDAVRLLVLRGLEVTAPGGGK